MIFLRGILFVRCFAILCLPFSFERFKCGETGTFLWSDVHFHLILWVRECWRSRWSYARVLLEIVLELKVLICILIMPSNVVPFSSTFFYSYFGSFLCYVIPLVLGVGWLWYNGYLLLTVNAYILGMGLLRGIVLWRTDWWDKLLNSCLMKLLLGHFCGISTEKEIKFAPFLMFSCKSSLVMLMFINPH